MKVAIITLHRVYNYGSVLQAYATQRVFEKAGHDVVIIDYITSQRTKKKIFKVPAAGQNLGMASWIYRCLKPVSILLKEWTFGRFIRKYLNLTSKYVSSDSLEKNPPIADLYVTGSDQTWNSDYNEGVDKGFFLSFAPDEGKRVSFASSFGKTVLSDDEILQTKPLIAKYDKLSVRETSGLDALHQLGRDDGIQIIDPTLQLRKSEWLEIASRRLVKEPYLILMLLYNEDNHATEYAGKIAKEKNLKLVKISWEMKKSKGIDKLYTHRSPAVFLSLFAYADFVVTNSFHGLAFSINLHRQFLVVPRTEYNSRIESLLQLTHLFDRMVSSEETAVKESEKIIDFDRVEQCIEKERVKAFDYIHDL